MSFTEEELPWKNDCLLNAMSEKSDICFETDVLLGEHLFSIKSCQFNSFRFLGRWTHLCNNQRNTQSKPWFMSVVNVIMRMRSKPRIPSDVESVDTGSCTRRGPRDVSTTIISIDRILIQWLFLHLQWLSLMLDKRSVCIYLACVQVDWHVMTGTTK